MTQPKRLSLLGTDVRCIPTPDDKMSPAGRLDLACHFEPQFEKCKVQALDERLLSSSKRMAVKCFLIANMEADNDSNTDAAEERRQILVV